MAADPEFFKRLLATSVAEFETLVAQETNTMEAYHHANYELSALLCILAEQIEEGYEEASNAVGAIVEYYDEIAQRAGVDFSPYEDIEE